MKALSHREACYELRRTASLYGSGKITLEAWYQSVCRILEAARYCAPSTPAALSGALP